MKTTRVLPSFQGVAAGQTATLTLPLGLTYHSIELTYTGVTLAQLKEIRIKGNGKPLSTISAVDMDKTNVFNGLSAANGILRIAFDRVKLLTRMGQELTAIGTGAPVNNDPKSGMYNPTPLSTFQLEIDIDAAATAPVLSAKAVQSAPRPLGAILKRRRFTYNQTGAGEYEISDLPKGDLIDKLWIKTSGGDIQKVVLERNNFVSFERTPAENSLIQADGVRAPQADWFVIDPTENGFGAESIVSAVNDFRLKITTDAATTFTVYVDYLGALGGN